MVFLVCAFPAPVAAAFRIQDSRLLLDDEPFVVRGVVYSHVPIGSNGPDPIHGAGCLYARDFPLIAALGANTVRTLVRVPPRDRAFRQAMLWNDLYWLAGFPLDRFHDATRSLAASTPDGRALREQILSEFRDYVDGWRDEPRLIAFIFGHDVARDYDEKFAGDLTDFYTLLTEAAAMIRQSGENAPLVTTTVSDVGQISQPSLGSDDASLPALSFWSLDRIGSMPLAPVLATVAARTSKPLLVSAFGIDAFDQREQREDERVQAETVAAQASEIEAVVETGEAALLGGVAASFLDEWWRGGPNPRQHGTEGRVATDSPDGFLNEAWLGLFRVLSAGTRGFDWLRPREASFALAAAWEGDPPPEWSQSEFPRVDIGGVRNMAGDQPLLAPGGLLSIRGRNFASSPRSNAAADLPIQLGAVSACIDDQPIPVFFVSDSEIRGQAPWELPLGLAKTVVYRAGRPGNAGEVEVAALAPGIFEDGVYQPGKPCPVNEANGVRPGSYLEVWGSGLGPAEAELVSGLAPDHVTAPRAMPRAWLGSRELPVLFSAMIPGFVGIYQTNVHVPKDFPPSTAELSLTQADVSSNAHRLRVVSEDEPAGFSLLGPEPAPFLLQAGGPTQTRLILLQGFSSFCEPVGFQVSGLPPGVRASISSGFPGQSLPLTIEAELSAPPSDDREALLTGFSDSAGSVTLPFELTILPSQGDIAVRVVSGGWLSGAPVASFTVAGRLLYEVQGGGPGRGFNFLTIDPETGVLGEPASFDTWASEEAVLALETYLQSLPDGTVVLGAIADDGLLLITEQTRRILRETLGARIIEFLEYQNSWAIITHKGSERPLMEGMRPNGLVVLDRVLSFPMEGS